MRLSAPTMIVFLISLVIGVVSLFSYYGGLNLPINSYHLALVAWLVLSVGTILKGL